MKLWDGMLDAVLPPLCLACRAPVAQQQAVCADCWRKLNFIGPPCCDGCGIPFAVPALEGSRCGQCLGFPPAFSAARAALVYDDASRALILGFKHADQTFAAQALAGWMKRAGRGLLDGCDMIAPVPLHYFRLVRRRYNQAAILASELAGMSGKKCVPDLLIRHRATPSQGTLHRRDRAKNVKDAFRINPRHAPFLQGMRVLLVDDVLTTGATVNACSRTLLEEGAGTVSVLALARVHKLS